jgi:hypothetical protein
MKNYTTRITDALWEDYAPRVTVGKGDDAKEVVDPNVLWVGPWIDGMLTFVESDLAALTKKADKRRAFKGFLADTDATSPLHAYDLVTQIHFTRPSWPVQASGLPTVLNITRRRLGEEPGMIKNSFVFHNDPETGEDRLVDPVNLSDGGRLTDVRPEILVDRRFGLHYLLRGDEIEFEWADRRFRIFKQLFRLRPRVEGSSLIIPEVATGVVNF